MLLGSPVQSSWNHIGRRSESIAGNVAIVFACCAAQAEDLWIFQSLLRNLPFSHFCQEFSVSAFVVLPLRVFCFSFLPCLSLVLEYNPVLLPGLSHHCRRLSLYISSLYTGTYVGWRYLHCTVISPAQLWAWIFRRKYWLFPFWSLSRVTVVASGLGRHFCRD